MKTRTILTILTIGLIFGSLTGISAKEINQRPHLEPGAHARAMSVIAGGLIKPASDEEEATDDDEEEVANGCD